MSPGESFIRRQDDELKAYEHDYRNKATRLVELWRKKASATSQTNALLEMHRAGTEYFRRLESEVFNFGSLRGSEYNRWKAEWIGTAKKNLHELPRYQRILRENREHLGLSDTMFEPPQGAYFNLQRFFAATCPKDVDSVRRVLAEAGIPVDGLSSPYLPKVPYDLTFMRPFIWVGVIIVLLGVIAVASRYMHAIVLGGVLSVIVVLLVIISSIELLREGKLKEKSFLEIVKLALAKRFQFVFGQKSDDDRKSTKSK